ncbi:MAG: M56 family metallopeptidase [Flavobacteriaceae bacterium]|jgi:beta-lactamase regulating signal transducer with metallopeptidase domain|nr:M56 family metallopeptidase [Flavobacteriaceae bacterium]
MLIYLTKITLIWATALLLYKLLLENTTAHNFKRYYLLVTLLIAFVLPVLTFATHSATAVVNESIVKLNDIVIQTDTTIALQSINYKDVLYVMYVVGVLWMSFSFVKALIQMYRLKKQGTVVEENKHTVVWLSSIQTPFTFGNTIYAPLSFELTTANQMYQHELEHIQQKHTCDILLIELLKIMFWWNPLVYWYKDCMALNHEFLADRKCVQNTAQANDYLQLLLQQTYLEHNSELSSAFNYNLTKKRFIMITKKTNLWRNRLTVGFTTALFLTMGSFAVQAYTPPIESSTNVEQDHPTEPASYIGGMEKFNNFFVTNFEYPHIEADVKSVKIILKFTVQADGTPTDYEVVKDQFQLGEKAIEVLKKMPKWQPATENGKNVSSEFYLPITLQLNSGS